MAENGEYYHKWFSILGRKKIGLMKRTSCRFGEVDFNIRWIFIQRIINQELFCKGVLDMQCLVDQIVKIINFIKERGPNHRHLIRFLEVFGSDYINVLYHTAIHWLRLGKILRHVWDLKRFFFEMKEKDTEYPQHKELRWLSYLAFAVDLFEHMQEPNTKLQGNGAFAHEMYSTVKDFQLKLKLF